MAITINHTRPIDDEELLELSRRNPGYQLERSRDGQLIVTTTGVKSGYRSGEVFRQLAEWNRQTETGIAFDSSTGFCMPDGSVLSPDAAWLERTRWQARSSEEQEAFAPLCPDVVFEVRSKGNTADELQEKMRAYIASGAVLGILIDPYDRFVELWRANAEPIRIADQRRIAAGSPLDNFTLETERLYE